MFIAVVLRSSTQVFGWHCRDGAFERLNPPWQPFIVKERKGHNSPPADSFDFLSEVCYQWENATEIAKQAGIRVINIRIGVVLGAAGGILANVCL